MSFKRLSDGVRQIRNHFAVSRIRALGGIVGFEHEWDYTQNCFNERNPPAPHFLRRLLGDKLFAKARLVIFNEVSISAQELRVLAYLKDLDQLGIVDCKIATGAVSVLSDVRKLSYLSLCGTQIDESDILHLRALHNLETLVVTDTGLSQSAIERLQAWLPKCKIYHEPEQSVPVSHIFGIENERSIEKRGKK